MALNDQNVLALPELRTFYVRLTSVYQLLSVRIDNFWYESPPKFERNQSQSEIKFSQILRI